MLVVKRGDIFYADLSPVVGSEQGGIRPVLIVQNDIGNKYAPTTIVAPITSQIVKSKLPTHVEIDMKVSGLRDNSVILLEQVRTIDKSRVKEKISHLDDKIMDKVSKAWLISGGVISSKSKQEQFGEFYKYRIDTKLDVLGNCQYEFKKLKGNNLVNLIRKTISKCCASFLNTEGGRLFYGVTCNGIIKGVFIPPKEKNRINKTINDNLANIKPPIPKENFQINYHPVYNNKNKKIENLYVIEVIIPQSPDGKTIYFVNGTELYIRENGAKKKLLGTEIVDYIRKKY